MSAKDGFESEVLDLLFLNIPIAGIGDSEGILGSVSSGNFHIALQRVAADDAASGTECDYDGYSRVAVPRNASGFVRVGNNISNMAAVTFGVSTSSGTQTALTFTVNKGAATGVDDGILWGTLSPSFDISLGVPPEFSIGDLNINVD